MPGSGLLLLAAFLAACLGRSARAHVQGSEPAPLIPERVYTSALPGSEQRLAVLAPNTAVHGTPLPPDGAPLGRVAQPEACAAECLKRGPGCGWFLYCPAQVSQALLIETVDRNCRCEQAGA